MKLLLVAKNLSSDHYRIHEALIKKSEKSKSVLKFNLPGCKDSN